MAISTKKISDVPSSVKKMLERADQAIKQQNYSYAFEILRNVLLSEPGLTEARIKKLRHAQLAKIGHKGSIIRQITAMIKTAWIVFVQGPAALRKQDYAKALDLAEKAMNVDPTVLTTLNFLARATKEAELIEEAVNAMEVAVKFHPNNIDALKQLAELYQEQGQATKSVQILQHLQSIKPNDLDAQAKLKHATALAAMEDAQWEEADSYRDLIRDKDQAQALEQEARITPRDKETREDMIKNMEEKIASEPTSANYRKLAELCQQNEEFDKAIEAYKKVLELSSGIDPGIDAAITDCINEKYNHQIAELRKQAEAEPDKAEEYNRQIKELDDERNKTLLEKLENRVENYPNELQYRFELGEMYFTVGQIDKALNEFQHSQRNPNLINRSKLYMAKCLLRKGMPDLAIERLNEVLEKSRDKMREDTLKEMLYELVSAYEHKNEYDKAMENLKELYSIDVNYKDVASKMEKYYKSE
ncbi:MAG: tetratricopeptide repeat protein [Lentisphaeria bacterium]